MRSPSITRLKDGGDEIEKKCRVAEIVGLRNTQKSSNGKNSFRSNRHPKASSNGSGSRSKSSSRKRERSESSTPSTGSERDTDWTTSVASSSSSSDSDTDGRKSKRRKKSSSHVGAGSSTNESSTDYSTSDADGSTRRHKSSSSRERKSGRRKEKIDRKSKTKEKRRRQSGSVREKDSLSKKGRDREKERHKRKERHIKHRKEGGKKRTKERAEEMIVSPEQEIVKPTFARTPLQATMDAQEQQKALIRRNAELAKARLASGDLQRARDEQAEMQRLYGAVDWRATKKLRTEKKRLERTIAAGNKLASMEEREIARMDAFRVALGLPTAEAQRQAEWRAEATRALAEQEAIMKESTLCSSGRPPKHSVIGPRLPHR